GQRDRLAQPWEWRRIDHAIAKRCGEQVEADPSDDDHADHANELRPPEKLHHAVDDALQRRGVFPMLGAKLRNRRDRLVDVNGNSPRRVIHVRQGDSSKWKIRCRSGAKMAPAGPSVATALASRF